MRMLLRASLPTHKANAAFVKGTFASTIEKILGQLKPEAAYFVEEDGVRTAYVVFDMKDSSELPAIAEPLFLAFEAKVTVRPAMNSEDLAKATHAIQQAVAEYGK